MQLQAIGGGKGNAAPNSPEDARQARQGASPIPGWRKRGEHTTCNQRKPEGGRCSSDTGNLDALRGGTRRRRHAIGLAAWDEIPMATPGRRWLLVRDASSMQLRLGGWGDRTQKPGQGARDVSWSARGLRMQCLDRWECVLR
jgi:hypothetical protein